MYSNYLSVNLIILYYSGTRATTPLSASAYGGHMETEHFVFVHWLAKDTKP